jgi:diguanylate cyclase (GGDEF)-like protein/putative nucleotidyltransferase with HDIG domain
MKSFSFITKLYLVATYVAGTAIFALHIGQVDLKDPWLLLILCVLASLALILKVEGSTNRSHYTFNFLVYGFTFAVYGPSEAMLVIVASNAAEWIWDRRPWFIQLFNAGSYVLVMQAAAVAYQWINMGESMDSWQAALAMMVSMTIFNGLNHLMVGIVIWLARGESFKKSGVFDFFPLMLDLSLLYLGASLSIVWNYNPFALGFFLVPLYLISSTLRVPALERRTEIDSKTGLFNHQHFKNQLSHELTRANRFDRPLSIMLADLDLLRNINNTYGHLAGDEVLIGMAKALKASVREYDVVCRFGGEEFAILLPETTLSQAFERAELIRKKIEETEFPVPTSTTPIRATMSFGIAQREDFGQAPDEIVHNADLALYHSKLSGRNRSYAYLNDSYVDFSTGYSETHTTPRSTLMAPKQEAEPVLQSPSCTMSNGSQALETEEPALETAAEEPDVKDHRGRSQSSKLAVGIFIGILALVSAAAFTAIMRSMPFITNRESFDWLGLLVLAILVVVSEAFSVDLYVRQSSVSTSAVPILVAYLLFGPVGVLAVSLSLAVSLLIKYRSRFNRFVFNLCNHILAGTLSLTVVLLAGGNFIGLTSPHQLALSLISSAILFLTTTWMVTFGMSLDLKQPVRHLWMEQFSWLAPYYIGIGFIAYAMVFGYRHDHVTGLLLLVIPMILLRISQKQYVERTRQVVTELRQKNQMLQVNSEQIAELNEGLLLTLSEIIDLRDPYVLGHSKQVSQYATHIARSLGLNEKQIGLIRKAGLLHDIGKLGIPMEILTKPARLTLEEYEIVKKHAALGGELVKNSPSLRSLAPIIRHHHEYHNGEGYPDKLSGNQISIEARIVAISDAIEAMTSDRPYRKALKPEQVIEELNKHSGTQFDPRVVRAAVKMLNEIRPCESLMSNQSEGRLGNQFLAVGLRVA